MNRNNIRAGHVVNNTDNVSTYVESDEDIVYMCNVCGTFTEDKSVAKNHVKWYGHPIVALEPGLRVNING